jgi:hypothetical protein
VHHLLAEDGSTAISSNRDELLEIYKIAVEEYRFQGNLNWSWAQY